MHPGVYKSDAADVAVEAIRQLGAVASAAAAVIAARWAASRFKDDDDDDDTPAPA